MAEGENSVNRKINCEEIVVSSERVSRDFCAGSLELGAVKSLEYFWKDYKALTGNLEDQISQQECP